MIDLLLASAIDSSLRALVLAAAVALVLLLFRVRSSNTCHTAWSAVLLTMLLMPLLARLAPPLYVTAPAAFATTPATTAARVELPPVPIAISTDADLIGASSAVPISVSPRSSTTTAAPRPVTSGMRLSVVAMATYATGVVILLVRLLAGLAHLSRIRTNSRPIPQQQMWSSATDGVLESALIATPVTIGLFTPRIVLPGGWRQWTPEMLSAVLAHEREHVTRRDPLIAVIARLNCAVFWFHPLAWWLQRRLATLAEDACDDAAIKHITPRRYAETLLDIAAIVRRHRGRLVWQRVGVDGNGRLGRRIDRVLNGYPVPEPSRPRRALVAVSCAAVMVAAIACQQREKVEPLREDPELAAKLKADNSRADAYRDAQRMTRGEVAAHEKALQQNPENAATRQRLLTYYAWNGKNTQPWNENVAARRRHALWLARNHPESELVYRVRLYQTDDPDGYGELKKVWLAAAAAPGTDPEVISHAVWFIGLSERQVAEQILVRARAAAPDGPHARRWAHALGNIYGSAVHGDNPDAVWARQKLEATADADVLYAAGLSSRILPRDDARSRMRLLERASQLQGPGAEDARRALQFDREANPHLIAFGGAPRTKWAEMASQSNGMERLRQLSVLTEYEYMSAQSFNWTTQPAAARTEWGSQASTDVERDKREAAERYAHSKAYAQEALDLAASLTDTDARKHAFQAHIMYGLALLREGKGPDALRHLDEASRLPTPDDPATGGWASGREYTLVFALLKQGERKTIIEYLERAARQRDERRRNAMLEMAAAIRAGRMPEHYQRLIAAGHL